MEIQGFKIMEIGEITYTEYSYEERVKIREECSGLMDEAFEKRNKLLETIQKISGFVTDQNLWNKPIGLEYCKLRDEVIQLGYKLSGRFDIRIVMLKLCVESPSKVGEDVYTANIFKCLARGFKEEIFEVNSFQHKADSLLYRCEHLTTKAA